MLDASMLSLEWKSNCLSFLLKDKANTQRQRQKRRKDKYTDGCFSQMSTCFLWCGKKNAPLGFILLRCHRNCWRSLLPFFQGFLFRPGGQIIMIIFNASVMVTIGFGCGDDDYWINKYFSFFFDASLSYVTMAFEIKSQQFVFIFSIKGFQRPCHKRVLIASDLSSYFE